MKGRRGAGTIAVLITACILGAALLLSLAAGAIVYRNVQDRVARAGDRRLGLGYITAKIHSHDSAGSVYAGSLGGEDAVVLPERSEDGAYETYLYVHDGWLMELFCFQGANLQPWDGQPITEAEELRVTEEDGLLVLRYTGPEGHTETARVYVRSGAGGASLAGAQTTAEGIKL